MTPPDRHCNAFPAARKDATGGEGAPNATPADCEDGRTIELGIADIELPSVSVVPVADEIGPTVVGIPLRNQLASARIAHAMSNAREAQALLDEAVELLATVRGLHVETYQLGATVGALHETAALLTRHGSAAQHEGAPTDAPLVDLKNDPSCEEIAIWLSFGIPLNS